MICNPYLLFQKKIHQKQPEIIKVTYEFDLVGRIIGIQIKITEQKPDLIALNPVTI
jgi:hypothetical protein